MVEGLIVVRSRHLHDDSSRTTPVGLARYSVEFFEAAKCTDEKMGRRDGYEVSAPIPVMFLVGQSIELSLKAYLLNREVSLEKLRTKFGHDLHKLLKKAKELELMRIVDFTEDEFNTIEILNELYASKQLQYIVTGAKVIPIFGPLQIATKKLVLAVCKEVGFAPRHLAE